MAYKVKKGASGAYKGAAVGSAFGPVGTAVGAGIGALTGFFGGGKPAKKGFSTVGTGPVLPEGPALPPYAQTSNSFEHDNSVMKGRMTKRFY